MLKGKKAVAFAGLADNAQFFDSLEREGCILGHKFSFEDHHRYGCNDVDRIAQAAKKKGVDVLVTTLKDFVKIEAGNRWPVKLIAVDVNIHLTQGEDLFLTIVSEALGPRKK